MTYAMDEIKIIEADLDHDLHGQTILFLINEYAKDPMGDGDSLPKSVQERLIPGLRAHPTTIIFFATFKSKPAGIITCFKGFSTFMAKPLINISDYYVIPEFRGKKIGKMLLSAVEEKAKDIGCCKLTLEVQENNTSALKIYKNAGFSKDIHVKEAGGALFLTKQLPPDSVL